MHDDSLIHMIDLYNPFAQVNLFRMENAASHRLQELLTIQKAHGIAQSVARP